VGHFFGGQSKQVAFVGEIGSRCAPRASDWEETTKRDKRQSRRELSSSTSCFIAEHTDLSVGRNTCRVKRLVAHKREVGTVSQIKQGHTISWLPTMVQAMLDSIHMDTAIGQGLFHRLLNLLSWILLMQPKHLEKLFDASTIWPLLTQAT
jgi:hypothetical protein